MGSFDGFGFGLDALREEKNLISLPVILVELRFVCFVDHESGNMRVMKPT
jgi:hypothetical protein